MPNLRAARFTDDVFAYDATREGWSLAAASEEVEKKYPNTELTSDGFLKIRIHTPDQRGAWVDDLIGLSRVWLRSLPKDESRDLAAKLLNTANYLLDQRATKRHNWSESSDETSTPPQKNTRMTHADLQLLQCLTNLEEFTKLATSLK